MKKIEKNHEVSEIGYHFVWCPKFRHPILKDGVDIVVKNVIGETAQTYGWIIHALEVMDDHVHVFLQVTPTETPCNIVSTLKSLTAIQVFSKFPKLKGQKFWGTGLWSRGYYVGTCGNMSKDIIQKYIETQKKKG